MNYQRTIKLLVCLCLLALFYNYGNFAFYSDHLEVCYIVFRLIIQVLLWSAVAWLLTSKTGLLKLVRIVLIAILLLVFVPVSLDILRDSNSVFRGKRLSISPDIEVVERRHGPGSTNILVTCQQSEAVPLGALVDNLFCIFAEIPIIDKVTYRTECLWSGSSLPTTNQVNTIESNFESQRRLRMNTN